MESDVEETRQCLTCRACLMVPYIQCQECLDHQTLLCLPCFAKGRETKQHLSYHRYSVVKNDFPLFEASWTADEELRLLEAISECGIGNWQDVANQVRSKNASQCKTHYHAFYLNNPAPPLPEIPEARRTVFPTAVVYKCCEEPPRPAEGSLTQLEMSGYMPPRGDFTTEFDNFVEMDLRDLSFSTDDDTAETEVKLAVLDIYRGQLKERFRRKKIVRDHGLIDIKKTQVVKKRYERILGGIAETLTSFAQLLPPIEFDKYLEALQYECELKQDISRLQDQRSAGLLKRASARIYESLKKDREESRGRYNMLTDVLTHIQDEAACQQWLQRQAMIHSEGGCAPILPSVARRLAPPLDIQNMPGYDKLKDTERELCANIRLVPESFIEFKRLLVNEYVKIGSLRLAQARNLIKIDVNKTRKLFDFLVAEGTIKKEVA